MKTITECRLKNSKKSTFDLADFFPKRKRVRKVLPFIPKN